MIALVPSSEDKPAQLVLLPTGAGETRVLVSHGFERFVRAAWLPEGKSIVFTGNQPGSVSRIYLLEVATGRFRTIAPEGVSLAVPGSNAFLSTDGKFVLANREAETLLWPIGAGDPITIAGLLPGDVVFQPSANGESVFVYRLMNAPLKVWSLDVRTGKRRLWKEFQGIESTTFVDSFFVTPNGESYAYRTSRAISTGYVIEGLR